MYQASLDVLYTGPMNIGKWIRETRTAAGLSQEQLGEAVARGKANVSGWETGKHEPSYSIILAIYEVTGAKIPPPGLDLPNRLSIGVRAIGGDELEIPRFEAPASMGTGRIQPDSENIVELLRVTGAWIRNTLPHISNPSNLAILPASGDSMEPTFSDSDLLWVDRGITDIKTDAIYVLVLRENLYVKRLQRRPDGAILMISDNRSYDPYVISNGEREGLCVLGRVVFAWRGKRL